MITELILRRSVNARSLTTLLHESPKNKTTSHLEWEAEVNEKLMRAFSYDTLRVLAIWVFLLFISKHIKEKKSASAFIIHTFGTLGSKQFLLNLVLFTCASPCCLSVDTQFVQYAL